jgi:hypothetical protein
MHRSNSPHIPLSALGGRRGWGSPGVRNSRATHLTLPAPRVKLVGLRLTPRRALPLPPEAGGEGQGAREALKTWVAGTSPATGMLFSCTRFRPRNRGSGTETGLALAEIRQGR